MSKTPDEDIPKVLVSGNGDKKKALDPEVEKVLQFNSEEIKSMREEINWRVKSAYSASIIFLSAITFIGGTLFSQGNELVNRLQSDNDLFCIVGIVSLILVSAWSGVQNANHLIEKRIELYSLELMKTMHRNSGHVYFSWLGYLYGSPYYKNKVKDGIAKTLSASIGFFIYLLPNGTALALWIYMLINVDTSHYRLLFIVASVFLIIAVCASFFFFIYMFKVLKKYKDFHDQIMEEYFAGVKK